MAELTAQQRHIHDLIRGQPVWWLKRVRYVAMPKPRHHVHRVFTSGTGMVPLAVGTTPFAHANLPQHLAGEALGKIMAAFMTADIPEDADLPHIIVGVYVDTACAEYGVTVTHDGAPAEEIPT